jgi:streptogramin lyase
MIEIQMLRHGNRALASAQTRFFRKAAERMGLAMTLALLSVVFCSAAAAQTAHFSWVQANLGGWFDNSVGIAVDASGNVYVSLNGATTVEEIVAVNGVIPPSPTILTLGGGFDYPIGLAVDSSGNVYVADSFNAAVKKIPPGCATSACVAPLGGGFVFPVGVALDAAGNVYVIDDIAGDDTALLKEIPVGCALAACVNTVAGGFFDPRGVAVDSHGNAYIADTENHAVKEVEAVGGSIPASPTIRTLAAGNFPYPEGVAVDSSGDVYVADGSSDQVIEILAFSGSIPVSPTLIPLGSGLKSDIEQAQGIALDAAGNVYVADLSSVREISFSSSGPSFNLGAANVNSATGTITLGYTFDSAGEIAAPVVVTQGSAGLDFADAKTGTCTTNGTSHSYSAGNICTVDVTLTPATWGPRYGAVELYGNSANLLATNYVYGTGVGPQAIFPAAGWLAGIGSGFANPTGLAVDAGGNLYVADPANLLLSKIAPSGSVTALPAGTGPYSVAIDGAGNLFVTETGANPGVFEIPAAGGYQTINELSGAAGYYDLRGIALDVNGNVFVAAYDYGNVYELTAASGYSTIKDLAPTITFAIGIAVDLNGNVFVSDDQDHFVGEIPAPDYSTLKVLNNSLDIWYPKGIALDGNDNIYATSMFGLQEILASSNYATVKTLAGNVSGIQSVALDGSGNIYYTVEDGANVAFMNRWLGPDLTFAATAEGSTSSDSPQTVTVENSGNATLDFLAIGYPENFPQDHPAKDDCYSGGSLEAGASCNFAVGFAPLSLGPLISAVALVDNSLYAPGYAVQYVSVTGTGLIPQAITFTDSLPSSANYSAGLAYTLSATGGGSGNPVTFSLVSGPATLAGSALTITGAGTVVVAANQARQRNLRRRPAGHAKHHHQDRRADHQLPGHRRHSLCRNADHPVGHGQLGTRRHLHLPNALRLHRRRRHRLAADAGNLHHPRHPGRQRHLGSGGLRPAERHRAPQRSDHHFPGHHRHRVHPGPSASVGHGQLRPRRQLRLGHQFSLHGRGNHRLADCHRHLRDPCHASRQQRLHSRPTGLAELRGAHQSADDQLPRHHRHAICLHATDAERHGHLRPDGQLRLHHALRLHRGAAQASLLTPRNLHSASHAGGQRRLLRRDAGPAERGRASGSANHQLPGHRQPDRRSERDSVGHSQLRADSQLLVRHNHSLLGFGNDGHDAYHGNLRDSRNAGGQQCLLSRPAGFAELHS